MSWSCTPTSPSSIPQPRSCIPHVLQPCTPYLPVLDPIPCTPHPTSSQSLAGAGGGGGGSIPFPNTGDLQSPAEKLPAPYKPPDEAPREPASSQGGAARSPPSPCDAVGVWGRCSVCHPSLTPKAALAPRGTQQGHRPARSWAITLGWVGKHPRSWASTPGRVGEHPWGGVSPPRWPWGAQTTRQGKGRRQPRLGRVAACASVCSRVCTRVRRGL